MGKQVKDGWTPPNDAVETAQENTVEQQTTTEWTPPADAIPSVKKKDEEKELVSSKGSEGPGQPSEKSGKNIQLSPDQITQLNKAVKEKTPREQQWEEIQRREKQKALEGGERLKEELTPSEDIVTSTVRGAVGMVKDILPASWLRARASGVKVTPYTEADLHDPNSINAAANHLFRKYVSEGEFMKALNVGDKEAVAYIAEQMKKPEEFQKSQIEEKVRLLNKAKEEQGEFEEFTKNTVKSLDQIKSPVDVASYVGYTVGQSIPQIGVSLATGSMGSFIQEYSEIYDEQIRKIAEDKGISEEEVIRQGLDDPEAGKGAALIAAGLDRIGVEAIFKNFGEQAFKNILRSGSKIQAAKYLGIQSLKTGGSEAVTEGAQYVAEEVGSSLAAGRTLKESLGDVSSKKLIENVAAGAISGGVLGGAGEASSVLRSQQDAVPVKEVVQEQIKTTPVESAQALDQSAEIIQAKVESASPVAQVEQPATPVAQEPITEAPPITQAPKVAEEEPAQTIVPEDIHKAAEQAGIDYESDEFMDKSKELTGKEHLDDMTPDELDTMLGYVQSQQPQQNDSQNQQQPVSGEIGKRQEPIQTEPVKEGSSQEAETGRVFQAPKEVTTTQAGPRELKIATRILASDANESIKKGIRDQGPDYIPKKLDLTDKEAKDLIEYYGPEKSESLIRDTKNEITGDTRAALAARLYEKYKTDADKITDPKQKERLLNKAVDVAMIGAEQAKEAGRAVNANKIWKMITSDEDSTIIALKKANKQIASKLIEPVKQDVTQTKQQIDDQIRRLVETKVQETVEGRLKRAKLITKENKKAIADAFDSLKVKDVKGTANDISRVIGSAVWNGSLEIMKRAVLTGADLANAMQAGIDYVRDHYKGSDFNEDDFKNIVTPAIQSIIPQEKISKADIDTKTINTKLKGSKKKGLINDVVDEYNKTGQLTDERFEEIYAKQLGYKELSEEDTGQIRELAKTISEAEKFEDEVKENFTKENIAKYQDLLNKAQKANQKLQAFAQAPSNIWDTLITMMQGNLLTPLSIVTNVYSNAFLQPLRFLSTGIASVIDRSTVTLSKMELLNKSYRDKTIDLTALQKGYFQGVWNGTLEGLKQLKEGQLADERNLREIQSSFNPIRAIDRWANKDRTLNQKINDYIEGTVGWTAEGMFRMLNFGDKPYRRAAELARAIEIGELRKLKGDDLLKFIMFPDESSAAKIEKAGKEATFQQDSELTKKIQGSISKMLDLVSRVPVIGGPAKLLLKSQIPFVKTPLNIVLETFDYALPPLTMARGIYTMRNGSKRDGAILIGKAVTGAIIMGAAQQLFKLGLLSWEDDKDKKGRSIQYDTVPPSSLNVSALTRGLTSGDFSIQDQDMWVNYKKMGIIGILFDNYTNNYQQSLKESGEMPGNIESILTSPLRVASSSLEQSFLKGTNSLMNAIQDGGGYETQQWAIETTGAIASIVYPNTLATVSKSSDEFIRDTYDKKFTERLKSTFKAKMFVGGELPPKINVWGDKVTGNPEGRNKYIYYLFDPTKFKEVDVDSYRYKIYDAWKQDNFNNDWLPSVPKRNLKVKGVDMKLSPKEFELLSTYVGTARANSVQTYVNSSWRYHTNEQRIERLKQLYQEGYSHGKELFMMKSGWALLTPKKLEEINKKNR